MIAQRKKSLNEYNEQLKKKDATINSLSNILRTFIEKSNAANNYPAAPNQEFAELRTGSMNAKRPQEMCQEEEPLTKRTRSMDINVMNVIPFSQAHQEDFNGESSQTDYFITSNF